MSTPKRPNVSMNNSNPSSAGVVAMALHFWTITGAVLNLTGTIDVSWWLVFAPWLLMLGLGLVATFLLGAISLGEKK